MWKISRCVLSLKSLIIYNVKCYFAYRIKIGSLFDKVKIEFILNVIFQIKIIESWQCVERIYKEDKIWGLYQIERRQIAYYIVEQLFS